MARYIRVTHQFTQRQHDWLVAESDRLGISIPDLLRRILDDWIDRYAPGKRPQTGVNQDGVEICCKTCAYCAHNGKVPAEAPCEKCDQDYSHWTEKR